MQVSVETLKGLERKVTISVPTDQMEGEISTRLRNLARKVKIDGFRPGKAPLHVVEKRYGPDVRDEVMRETVEKTLFDALKSKELIPVSTPMIDPDQLKPGEGFKYSATFEVFPDIEVVELDQPEIELMKSRVTDRNIQEMLDKLRAQNKKWVEVDREVNAQDKVIFDFEGLIDNKPFPGGTAKGYELIVGSQSMIPGFEEALLNHHKGDVFDINLTFPSDYSHKELAAKDAVFKINLLTVMEGILPALDEELAKAFNITEGGVDALVKDVKANMERELERRIKIVNREKIFDELLKVNQFDIPNTLVEKEIEHLRHELYHQIFGPKHSEEEQIPNFPRELFEEKATRRVKLGLLFAEYVKKHKLVADKGLVDEMIDKLAQAYEEPEELKKWYRGNKERMTEIETLVLEDVVAAKISESAKLIEKDVDYNTVMNTSLKKEEQEQNGAKE